MMRSFVRATLALGAASVFGLCLVLGAGAQAAQPATAPKSGEKTVEEAYLQESLETMIIKEQSQSDSKDMKLVALQYIKQAVDAGRKNEEIRKSLEYLALETTMVVTRSAGLGRPTNDYPDIRAKACDLLGEFPSVESKNALLKVALGDAEPMVLSAAVRSLGKIGMNDGDDVTQTIAFIVNRFDILMPDNSLAFESLIAIERIADKNNGIKDPAAIRAVMKIATGNYITPVRAKANEILGKLRKYSAGSGGSGR
ncbi:MAG TPA: HEAT repeat domain-containing protein [Spirochaetales bacterium]|nr:HEAT repeat domain-containing protein [Spirochaetales bacterium]